LLPLGQSPEVSGTGESRSSGAARVVQKSVKERPHAEKKEHTESKCHHQEAGCLKKKQTKYQASDRPGGSEAPDHKLMDLGAAGI
jgi:hypothetical protein